MISTAEWIQLMNMLSDPNSVLNHVFFRNVRNEIEALLLESHPARVAPITAGSAR